MKIGLVDTMHKGNNRAPNLAIASLAGFLLSRRYEVGILDLYFSGGRDQRRFLESHWDLIGITATSFAFPVAQATIREIRLRNPDVPIVLGGPHASIMREQLLEKEKGLDYAIWGEGEIPLVELAGLLGQGSRPRPQDLVKIPGLIYRAGDKVAINPPAERIKDLDSLPLPPYHLFPMDRYEEHAIYTSRGCPYACVYCASWTIFGRSWVARSPLKVVEEMEYMIAHWGRKPFAIVEDTFNLKTERVKELCRLIIARKLGISWRPDGIRADQVDSEMLDLMKKSGCDSVSVGIESANPEVLKNIGKGETIVEIREGILKMKSAGLSVCGMFMIGNPGDTLETIRESIAFAKSLQLDTVRFYQAVPYPNTRLWTYVEQEGRFLRQDIENIYDFTEKPVFETKTFPAADRLEAYRLTMPLMFPEGQPKAATLFGPRIIRFVRRLRAEGMPVLFRAVQRRLRRMISALRRWKFRGEEAGKLIHTRYSRQ